MFFNSPPKTKGRFLFIIAHGKELVAYSKYNFVYHLEFVVIES